jgi:hypothetical protein
LPIRWTQQFHRPTFDLISLVTEHSLGTVIPTVDDSVQRHTDDRVFRGLHDRGELAAYLFRFGAQSNKTDDRLSADQPSDNCC